MKNYWLNKREDKDLSEKQRFDKLLKLFQEHPHDEMAKSNFSESLYLLAEMMAKYVEKMGWKIEKYDLIQELVMVGLMKAPRFNWTANSFNYFTTCMLGHARQLRRSNKNYKELQKRYEEHLKSS